MDDVVLEERTFSEVKRLCCAGRPDGLALLGEVIERLRRVVPFEAYCASTKDPATGFITHGMAEETGGEDPPPWTGRSRGAILPWPMRSPDLLGSGT